MVIERYPHWPLTKSILYRPEICGNNINIFWGWDENHQIPIQNNFQYPKMHYLLGNSGIWVASVLCRKFTTLVSQKTRIVECGVFLMGDPGSVNIAVH